MKTKLVYALAGALALGFTTYTHAEDKPAHHEGRAQGGQFSPEQREKFAKDLGLNPDDLKNLSPEERRTKIKEAAEKKMAELQKKQTDGTISADEKETLERLERIKKMREQGGGGFGSPEHREQFLKDIGVNPDDVKNLSPEERMAKVSEAAKKKEAELQKKQTDGTITADEKELLQKIEQRRKIMQGFQGGHGGHHGEKHGDDKK